MTTMTAERIAATTAAVNRVLAENAARKAEQNSPTIDCGPVPTHHTEAQEHLAGCECGNYYGPNSQCFL